MLNGRLGRSISYDRPPADRQSMNKQEHSGKTSPKQGMMPLFGLYTAAPYTFTAGQDSGEPIDLSVVPLGMH